MMEGGNNGSVKELWGPEKSEWSKERLGIIEYIIDRFASGSLALAHKRRQQLTKKPISFFNSREKDMVPHSVWARPSFGSATTKQTVASRAL